jgi:hypothetical protein
VDEPEADDMSPSGIDVLPEALVRAVRKVQGFGLVAETAKLGGGDGDVGLRVELW